MKVPVQWLKDYVSLVDIDISTLEERLVMSGSNSETVHILNKGIEKVVVGHILSIEQHPDAQKLVVCQVAIGSEAPIQIVTGAKNMQVGDYIPVALDGAVLAGNLEIKNGELRGQLSQGMFCSLQELGFDDKVIPKAFLEGLLILDKPYPLGMDVFEAIHLDDAVIEFEITPNRPDCLSMLGMAREVAATFDLPIMLPDTSIVHTQGSIDQEASVVVEDSTLCPRYACRVVKNVTVKPSPQWLQSKLIKAGMRPINNIVDVTNYVLLEYGQPIHAFDLERLVDRKIVVRHALPGEKMKTLDDQERDLTPDMLVIADGARAVAIAGIMGGQDTEVSAHTKELLIEVANFNKSSIRESSKKLGLRSEASSRYEKGISPEVVEDALNRVCHLIEKLGAGEIIDGVIDVYPNKFIQPAIIVRPDRINQLLGTKLSIEEIQSLLLRIECTVVPKSNGLSVTPPPYRLDLLKEIDFVEEVARLYGYDKLEETMPLDASFGSYTPVQMMERMVRENLTGQGLNEICTYSFVSPKILDTLNYSQEDPIRQSVLIRNPLGEEYSMMRPNLYSNLLQVISRNTKRQVETVMVYEIGSVFKPRTYPIVDEPLELRKIGMGMIGDSIDFFTLKGAVLSLLNRLKIKSTKFVVSEAHASFHPGRTAEIWSDNHYIGVIGEVHPAVQERYDLTKRTYVAELDFECLASLATVDYIFEPLPKFPAATRDIAITVDRVIENGVIEALIAEHGGTLLETVRLFDVYQGSQIEEGKKSMAYALTFRAVDRTLVEADIQGTFNLILEALQSKLNAQLR